MSRIATASLLSCLLGACESGSTGESALRYVFITSNGMPTSDMGGLSGVDSYCTTYAQGGGLAGTWKAWMSDENTNAIDRIDDVGPWYLVGTVTVAAADKSAFATTPSAMINITQTGATLGAFPIGAATGTTGAGLKSSGGTCASWTATSGSYAALQIQPSSIWQVSSGTCSSAGVSRVICIQQ